MSNDDNDMVYGWLEMAFRSSICQAQHEDLAAVRDLGKERNSAEVNDQISDFCQFRATIFKSDPRNTVACTVQVAPKVRAFQKPAETDR